MGSFLRGWFLVLFGFLGILFFCGCREREERDLAARLERPMVVVRLFPQYPHVTRESMILDFIPLEEIITREKLTLPSGKEGQPMGHVYTGASGQEYLRVLVTLKPYKWHFVFLWFLLGALPPNPWSFSGIGTSGESLKEAVFSRHRPGFRPFVHPAIP